MKRLGGNAAFQQYCYSGQKRFHCLLYQSLTTPDGLLFALYGPTAGRRYDRTVLRNSEWEGILHECLYYDDEQYYFLGDKVYTLRPYLIRPFVGAALSDEEEQFNTFMRFLQGPRTAMGEPRCPPKFKGSKSSYSLIIQSIGDFLES